MAEQSKCCLGARRLRDVVRHRRPDRQRRYPGPAARVVDDPDDAGRAFVARGLQVQAARDPFVRRGAAHRHRSGVRRVGKQRAERHHHLHAELVAALEQLGRERLPPHVRLDAADQDHVPADVGQPRERDPRRRPGDEPPTVVVEGDHRPVDLVVVVVLGLERPQRGRGPQLLEVLDRGGCGVPGVVPALEGRDQDGVHQLGKSLELDHPQPPVPTCRSVLWRVRAGLCLTMQPATQGPHAWAS